MTSDPENRDERAPDVPRGEAEAASLPVTETAQSEEEASPSGERARTVTEDARQASEEGGVTPPTKDDEAESSAADEIEAVTEEAVTEEPVTEEPVTEEPVPRSP